VRIKRTSTGFKIKKWIDWGEGVLAALKISTSHNPSVVRWVAQMHGDAEQ